MSKITNDDLTRSGTGCFYSNSGRQRVNVDSRIESHITETQPNK